MKIGSLVRMHTHQTGFVGVVVSFNKRGYGRTALVGVRWIGGSGKIDWEPKAWLEVISEGG